MADSSNFLSSRVVSIITAWLDKHADSHIPFVDQAELISHVTQVIEPPTPTAPTAPNDPVEKYCVIGGDYPHTYHNTPEEAAQAAGVMIRDNIRLELTQRVGKTCKKMLIVKTVQVVEEAPPVPPFTSVRPPVAADFAHRRPKPYYPAEGTWWFQSYRGWPDPH